MCLQHINLYYQRKRIRSMPTKIDREIQNLINELEDLRIEFNTKSDIITRKLTRLRRQVNKTQKEQFITDELEIGELVRITNSYKGQKGTTGIIERITEKQVTIRNQNSNIRYTRSKKNVEKVL
jgi:uncharacterized NAD(P)/FAD-binding protein YdhS